MQFKCQALIIYLFGFLLNVIKNRKKEEEEKKKTS